MQFDVLGRAFRAGNLPPELGARVRHAWDFPEHQGPAANYRVDLDSGPVDLTPWQSYAPRQVLACGEHFEVRVAPDSFAFEDATGALICRHVPGATLIRLQQRPEGGVASPELEAALYVGVNEGLWCSGLLPLHAASAALEGSACAFVGPSGRGKSSTLMRAVRAGWVPVAEDVLWCDPQRWLVYGWEHEVRLLPDSVALLPPALAHQQWHTTADGKVNVPYAALPGAGVSRGGVPLRRLAVLEREPGLPSAWLPLSTREATLALWEATGLPLAQRARQYAAEHIAALQANVECLRLRLGSTPLPLATSEFAH